MTESRLRMRVATSAALCVAALLAPRLAAASGPERCIAAADHGQQDRDTKKLLRARAELTECSAPSCPSLVRQECARWLEDVESALPSLVFIVRDDRGEDASAVRVSMDGAPLVDRLDGGAVPVDPGEHTFTFEVARGVVTERVLVHEGERNRPIMVRTPRVESAPRGNDASSEKPPTPVHAAPTPPTSTPAAAPANDGAPPLIAVIVGGGGAVALGAGIFVGAFAKSDLDRLERDPCATTRTCRGSDVDSIRARYIVADAAMAIGVAALGVATVLWLTHSTSQPPAIAARFPASLDF